MFTLNSFCKKILPVLLSVSLHKAHAQSMDELISINSSAKAMYVTPDKLDQLMIRLRPYFQQPGKETDSLFMSTLQTITNGYVANNHFKQGYQVYQQYVRFKEARLKADLDHSIAVANAAVDERRRKEDAQLSSLQHTVSGLQSDIDGYKGKRSGFKTYFSIAIIILSTIVAAMLVSTGVKLNNLRNRLKQNRERMKEIHRVSSLGSFSGGLTESIRKNLLEIRSAIKSLAMTFTGSGAEKVREAVKKL